MNNIIGLLMNSEVWVCLTDEERTLPFVLVEKGYDVWVIKHLAVCSFEHYLIIII